MELIRDSNDIFKIKNYKILTNKKKLFKDPPKKKNFEGHKIKKNDSSKIISKSVAFILAYQNKNKNNKEQKRHLVH